MSYLVDPGDCDVGRDQVLEELAKISLVGRDRVVAHVARGRLWQLFEDWLTRRFPAAARIFTDHAEPHEDIERNREFLKSLGYTHVAGTHRIFAKEVAGR